MQVNVRHPAGCRLPCAAGWQGARRGSLMVEVAVALIVIGVLLSLLVQMAAVSARQGRLESHRRTASAEAANCMERIWALHPGDIGVQSAGLRACVERVARALPEGSVEVTITPAAGDQPCDHAAVTVRWREPGQVAWSTVRLSAWLDPGAGGES